MRSHVCGELNRSNVGERVTVCGWVGRRREHGEHLAFVDLRDFSGVVQCVVDNTVDVRSEYVVQISGVVRQRPEGTVNEHLATGEVEIGECEVTILRAAAANPIDARPTRSTEPRLQCRYLDLRRTMQKNLRARRSAQRSARGDPPGLRRDSRHRLVPSTPAILVPSPEPARSTPQSLQLFKQLLMVAGFDQLLQIARCRLKHLRRPPVRVHQLDAEMSFKSDDVSAPEAVLDAAEAAVERPDRSADDLARGSDGPSDRSPTCAREGDRTTAPCRHRVWPCLGHV